MEQGHTTRVKGRLSTTYIVVLRPTFSARNTPAATPLPQVFCFQVTDSDTFFTYKGFTGM